MARDNKILNPENQNSKLQRDRGLPCGIPSLPLLGCPVSSLLLFSPTTSTSHCLPDSGPASIFLSHPSQQPHCHPPALCILHAFCPLSLRGSATWRAGPAPQPRIQALCLNTAPAFTWPCLPISVTAPGEALPIPSSVRSPHLHLSVHPYHPLNQRPLEGNYLSPEPRRLPTALVESTSKRCPKGPSPVPWRKQN